MTLEELKNKINKQNLKLKDLSIEEMLKFKEDGFLIPALSRFFKMEEKEVDKIRKRKGLNDYDFEDTFRYFLVISNDLIEHNPDFKPYQSILAYGLINGLGSARGKEALYNKKYEKIDWESLNILDEIQKKEIDIEYRRNQKIYLIGNQLIKKLEKKYDMIQEEWSLKKITQNEMKLQRKSKKEYTYYVSPRNNTTSENALALAKYKCECNPYHVTFTRKKNNLPYMEPHHLIPLEFQEFFSYSLDIECNIISLCSNCHNEIHYGKNNREMIKKFYTMRKEDLKRSGIEITLENLFQMYDNEYINL